MVPFWPKSNKQIMKYYSETHKDKNQYPMSAYYISSEIFLIFLGLGHQQVNSSLYKFIFWLNLTTKI